MSIVPLNTMARDFSPFADLLIWNASEETTSIWSSKVTTSNNQFRFSPQDISFGFNTGVRAGLLYRIDPSFWDLKLSWTYYHTEKNLGISVGSQIITPEFFSGFLSSNFFFGSRINWKIVMHTVDLETGYTFKLSKSFTIRPSMGIKGANINQTINSSWDAVIYIATEKVTQEFSALGPSFGIHTKWNIVDGLNLIGNFSTAFIWGNWNVNDTYKRPNAGLVRATTITTTMDHSLLGTILFSYFLGLEWAHPWKLPVTFNVGYEMQLWTNQLRLPTFQQLPVHGDLTFQGVKCGLEFDL